MPEKTTVGALKKSVTHHVAAKANPDQAKREETMDQLVKQAVDFLEDGGSTETLKLICSGK